MNCESAMQTKIEFIGEQDSIKDAAKKMADSDVGFLPVLDQNLKPLGTLTDRDICVRAVAQDKPGTTLVGDVMTRDAISVKPFDDVEEAERVMKDRKVSRVLVCDDGGRMVGVIGISDIAEATSGEETYDTLAGIKEVPQHPTH